MHLVIRPTVSAAARGSSGAGCRTSAADVQASRRRGRSLRSPTHHTGSGEPRFSEDCELEVTYTMPKFPLDPKTSMEKESMEIKITETGDRQAYKNLYPHLSDQEINRRIKQRRKDDMEQSLHEADVQVAVAKKLQEAGIVQVQETDSVSTNNVKTSKQRSTSMPSKDGGSVPGMDNKLKDAQDKSKQYKDENQQKPNKS